MRFIKILLLLVLFSTSVIKAENVFKDAFGSEISEVTAIGATATTGSLFETSSIDIWYALSNTWYSTGNDIRLDNLTTNYYPLCQFANWGTAVGSARDLYFTVSFTRLIGEARCSIRYLSSVSSNNLSANTDPTIGTLFLSITNSSAGTISTNIKFYSGNSLTTLVGGVVGNNPYALLTIMTRGSVTISSVVGWYSPIGDKNWKSDNLIYKDNKK